MSRGYRSLAYADLSRSGLEREMECQESIWHHNCEDESRHEEFRHIPNLLTHTLRFRLGPFTLPADGFRSSYIIHLNHLSSSC
jgi:hypothetical protein